MQSDQTIRRDYQPPAAAALAEAALYFVEGQYLFHTRSDRDEEVKYLSPAAVRQALLLEPVDSGWLSAETVRWGMGIRGEYVVSFHTPARYKLLVRGSDDVTEAVLTVPLPGFIFAGLDQSWYVRAVKAERFSPDLELFHAPLPNVSTSGLICFGQNWHPKAGKDDAHAAWQLFITSAFNSHHADGKSREYPQNILYRLYALSARNARRYPFSDLVSLNCTVSEAVQRLIER